MATKAKAATQKETGKFAVEKDGSEDYEVYEYVEEELSPSAIEKISIVRVLEARGLLSKQQVNRRIGVITGTDTGVGHYTSDHADQVEMAIATIRISDIYGNLSLIKDDINFRISDKNGDPRYDGCLRYSESKRAVEMLTTAIDDLGELSFSVDVLCAE